MSSEHPLTIKELIERNRLLQVCLRTEPLPFPIEHEYPLVLSANASQYSYCFKTENRITAHANLWPRIVINRQQDEICRVGLIGNVATDPALRGQGQMRRLFSQLEEAALFENLAALILWSDLDEFYHKLGFESFGKEYRLMFKGDELNEKDFFDVFWLSTRSLSDSELKALLDLRMATDLTLKRGIREFATLLAIPWTNLYVAMQDQVMVGYAIVGRGLDMQGIIHEWGATSPEAIINLVGSTMRHLEIESITLLAPASLDKEWMKELKDRIVYVEEKPMALCKPLNICHNIDDLFIWGLDSI